jgi:plasmid maintenance system antidote protein VapI
MNNILAKHIERKFRKIEQVLDCLEKSTDVTIFSKQQLLLFENIKTAMSYANNLDTSYGEWSNIQTKYKQMMENYLVIICLKFEKWSST